MINRFGNVVSRYHSDRRGNVAMIAALSIIPIVSIAGIAIDMQMTTTSKNRVQAIVDSAVIAGSKAMQDGKSKEQISQEVNAYAAALLSEQSNTMLTCTPITLSFSEDGQDIDASTVCDQEATLTKVMGKEKLTFKVSSGSTYGIGKVEVAFVFDVSGSMGNDGKMDDLKGAALLAVDTLLPDALVDDPNNEVRLAMVSYDTMVNAGGYFHAVTNKLPTRVYAGVKETEQNTTCKKWKRGKCKEWNTTTVSTPVTNTITNTCVKERIGGDAFTDNDPGPAAWLEAAESTYNKNKDRWDTETCNEFGPLPLTNDKDDLQDYVDALQPRSGTAGHMGVAWGWYLLSPEWKSVWPNASDPFDYDEPDAAKAIIMMTDGQFNSQFAPSLGSSDDQAELMCDAAKEAGVVIYTVAFQAPQSGKDILAYCASGPDKAFVPEDGDQLEDAYQFIAQSISDLRITQ